MKIYSHWRYKDKKHLLQRLWFAYKKDQQDQERLDRKDGFDVLAVAEWEAPSTAVELAEFLNLHCAQNTQIDLEQLARDQGVDFEALADAYEPADHTDDPCPCGDPECSRPWGHAEEVAP